MAKKSYDFLFKIFLIGDSGVGIREFLFKLAGECLNPLFVSTVGMEFKIRNMEVDGKKIKLQMWDTVGQERFKTVTSSYYTGAMGIMLVYDITNEKSFENMNNWMTNIQEYADEGVVVMIIGNNCHKENQREVSTNEGEELAELFGAKFMEVSAETGTNVEEVLITLTRDIKQKVDGLEQLEVDDLSEESSSKTATSSCTII